VGFIGGCFYITTARAAGKVYIVMRHFCIKSAFIEGPRNTEAKIDRLDYSFVYGER